MLFRSAVRNFRIAQLAKYPDISTAKLNAKVLRYSKKKLKLRTETIARTESARAQNYGTCETYQKEGVVEGELSASGGACEKCANMSGSRYPIAEARDIVPIHPSCCCVILPVIEGMV